MGPQSAPQRPQLALARMGLGPELGTPPDLSLGWGDSCLPHPTRSSLTNTKSAGGHGRGRKAHVPTREMAVPHRPGPAPVWRCHPQLRIGCSGSSAGSCWESVRLGAPSPGGLPLGWPRCFRYELPRSVCVLLLPHGRLAPVTCRASCCLVLVVAHSNWQHSGVSRCRFGGPTPLVLAPRAEGTHFTTSGRLWERQLTAFF